MTGFSSSAESTRSVALRQAGTFLAVTYLLALAIALALPHAGIAPLISIAVPVVAVAITVLVTTRAGGRRAAWAAVGFGLPSWRALVVAVVGPVVIVGLSFAVAAAVGVLRFGAPPGGLPNEVLGRTVATLVFGIVFLGEEIGWRGFLLLRLHAVMDGRRAALVTGACHALFHLPLLTLTTTYQYAGNRWIVVPTVLATLTLAGVWYGWLRLRSGSIWPVSLSHSAFNNCMEGAAAAAVAISPAAMAYTTTETGVVTLLIVLAVAGYLLTVRASDFDRPRRSGEVEVGRGDEERERDPRQHGPDPVQPEVPGTSDPPAGRYRPGIPPEDDLVVRLGEEPGTQQRAGDRGRETHRGQDERRPGGLVSQPDEGDDRGNQ
jgi:membrane protease YdiL (CAAX protease family)